MKDSTCIIITGPTASGKTPLALSLAKHVGGALINADSMQLYDHLSILTARPTVIEKSQAPYALDGVLSGDEKASTGWWLREAVYHIEQAFVGGFVPIVVGGTGMYLKCLREGLSPIPDVPKDIRCYVRDLRDQPLDALKAAYVFPNSATYTDSQRFLRAYEVFLATQQPIEDFYNVRTPPLSCRFMTIALIPEREALYAAIDTRFERMVGEGAITEVKELLQRNLSSDHPILKATGVAAITAYLKGDVNVAAAITLGQQHTRQYAKRQMTWIRNQGTSDMIMDSYALSLEEQITKILGRY
ncbi:MAG: tRNA (adenosine(37)-N6)-dimethylallyltransferase MiaA [Alphaproteobacteria bacterium]|nr:tRNA (adenosine(37)-N6)-dimethylallyltransferase MiaA [Alphaproteobacteria bacterium]